MNDTVVRRAQPLARPRGQASAGRQKSSYSNTSFLAPYLNSGKEAAKKLTEVLRETWKMADDQMRQALNYVESSFSHGRTAAFSAPFEGAVVSSEFYRENGDLHGALDLVHRNHGTVNGREVRAGVSGVLTKVVHSAQGRGGIRVSIFDANTGHTIRYMHLQAGSTAHLREGQRINQGEVIGRVGNTGTQRPHLHLQVEDSQGRKRPPGEVYPELNHLPAQVGRRRL